MLLSNSRITLGAGCFWCVEAALNQLDGIDSAISGYMGGHVENPTYEQVCTKQTGHVEVVQVNYDESSISTEKLLDWFWRLHDPTQPDGQGADIGPQYLTTIFYEDEAQKELAEASMKQAQEKFDRPIATKLRPAETFYPAEDYHQDYYFQNKSRNGYCQMVITPKLEKLGLRR